MIYFHFSISRVLCETIKSLITKVASHSYRGSSGPESLTAKCVVLNDKLDSLLGTLHEESLNFSNASIAIEENSIIEDVRLSFYKLY